MHARATYRQPTGGRDSVGGRNPGAARPDLAWPRWRSAKGLCVVTQKSKECNMVMKVLFIGGTGLISSASTQLAVASSIVTGCRNPDFALVLGGIGFAASEVLLVRTRLNTLTPGTSHHLQLLLFTARCNLSLAQGRDCHAVENQCAMTSEVDCSALPRGLYARRPNHRRSSTCQISPSGYGAP